MNFDVNFCQNKKIMSDSLLMNKPTENFPKS